MSFACYLYALRFYLYRMSSVCNSHILVCHPFVTRMYPYAILMSLVCTLMSSVGHSYVLVCHTYITRMYSHVIRMSLACGFTINQSKFVSQAISKLLKNNCIEKLDQKINVVISWQ